MNNDFGTTAIVFAGEGLGQGDIALRQKVAGTYLRTLIELEQYPQAILFYTAGVQLVAQSSPVVQELAELQEAGVELIACRSCLEYYGVIDKVAVGEVGNMMRIVEAQGAASKVILL